MNNNNKICYVHIGMPKTGSSTLQNYLTAYLQDDKFFYPDLFCPNHSEVIYTLFENNPETYHAFIARGLSKREVLISSIQNKRHLEKKILETDTKNMILSGEDIMNMSINGLEKLKHFLLLHFNNVKIIGYVRPIHSYMQSAFQELVKHGLNSFNLNSADPMYNRFFKFYRVFDPKDILLIPFVKERLYGEDIVHDFCKRVGLDVSDAYVRRVHNETLYKEEIALIYTYQKFQQQEKLHDKFFVERNILIDTIRNRVGETKFAFSPGITKEIVDINVTHIQELNRKYGVALDLNEDVMQTENSIKTENDLLNCAVDSIEVLEEIVGKECLPAVISKKSPEYVSHLMTALQKKLISEKSN